MTHARARLPIALAIGLLCAAGARAGDLSAPAAPDDPGSAMFTRQDNDRRLATGAPGAPRTGHSVERSGVQIAGVTGIATVGGGATAAEPRTGQTTCYDARGKSISCAGTGQDGDLLKGVAWPSPRFADNRNGTVIDNLTGLIWLKNANCFDVRTWEKALAEAKALANGQCGLTDGSTAGQWRLPNVHEQQSLIDYGRYNPALPSDHPFSGVQIFYYWSATSYAHSPALARYVILGDGGVDAWDKTKPGYVWPVRGGQ